MPYSCIEVNIYQLTHWGWDNIATISQTTLSNAFSWMKMLEFWLTFHWSLFLKGLFNNIPALVQIMAWRRPGDKPLSEAMMVSLLTHICVTLPQWVNNIAWWCQAITWSHVDWSSTRSLWTHLCAFSAVMLAHKRTLFFMSMFWLQSSWWHRRGEPIKAEVWPMASSW